MTQLFTPNYDHWAYTVLDNKRDYCEKHGYTFHYRRGLYEDAQDRHPSWHRIPLLFELFEDPEVEMGLLVRHRFSDHAKRGPVGVPDAGIRIKRSDHSQSGPWATLGRIGGRLPMLWAVFSKELRLVPKILASRVGFCR